MKTKIRSLAWFGLLAAAACSATDINVCGSIYLQEGASLSPGELTIYLTVSRYLGGGSTTENRYATINVTNRSYCIDYSQGALNPGIEHLEMTLFVEKPSGVRLQNHVSYIELEHPDGSVSQRLVPNLSHTYRAMVDLIYYKAANESQSKLMLAGFKAPQTVGSPPSIPINFFHRNLDQQSNKIRSYDYPNGNLIANGSFEAGLAGWSTTLGSFQQVGVRPHTGSSMGTIITDSKGIFDFTTNNFPIKPLTTYTLSFYYRCLSKTGDVRPSFMLTETGFVVIPSPHFHPADQEYAVNSDWTLYQYTFTTGANIHFGQLSLFGHGASAGGGFANGGGTFLFDDVLLEEGSQSSQSRISRKTDFFDGMNRPIQTVLEDEARDIVSGVEYDDVGRERRISLPTGYDYFQHNGRHSYLENFFGGPTGGHLGWYYSDSASPGPLSGGYAYTESRVEESPLGRPMEAIGPGDSWRDPNNKENGNHHSIKMGYSSTASLPAYGLDITPATAGNGVYKQTAGTGEDGTRSREITDLQGRLIRSGMYSKGRWLDVDYEYDRGDHLVRQVSPKGSDGQRLARVLTNNSLDQMLTDQHPDEGEVRYKYDLQGRLRFSRTEEQRLKGRFSYIKYDQRDRVVEQGIYTGLTAFDSGPDVSQDFPAYADSNKTVKAANFYDVPPPAGFSCLDGGVGISKTYIVREDADPSRPNEFTDLNSAYSAIQARLSGLASFAGSIRIIQVFPTPQYEVAPLVGSEFTKFSLQNPLNKVILDLEGVVKDSPEYFDALGEAPPFAIQWGPLGGRLVKTVACNSELADSPLGLHEVSTIFNYDRNGNVTETYEYNGYIEDAESRWQKTTQSHDVLNRVTKRNFYRNGSSGNPTVAYEYDYDHLGRAREIRESGSVVATFVYGSLGQNLSATLGKGTNKVTLQREYHFNGWLNSTLATADSAGRLFEQKLFYEEGSNPKFDGSISEFDYSLQPSPQPLDNFTFTYDAGNRLASATTTLESPLAWSPNAWGYDYNDNGTFSQVTRDGQSRLYQYYDTSNQLERADNAGPDRNTDQAHNFTYDEDGRLEVDASRGDAGMDIAYGDGGMPFRFNLEEGGANRSIYMIYDAGGNRRSKVEMDNGQTAASKHYFSSGKEVRTQPGESATEVYPFDGHGQIPINDQGEKEFEIYVKNHQGSTMRVYNTTRGADIFSADYDPYGHIRDGLENSGASDGNPLTPKFTGKEHDRAIGLDYFGARYYDADLALWISPDAARQFHSPYAYSPNPINSVDPTGLYSVGQHADGSFSRIDPAFDLFSDNASSVDVAVMSETWRSAFLHDGLGGLISEWGDMAVIALNHRGLISNVGELSSEFEYGAGFNRGLEQIPFTNNNPSSVHILPGWENEVHGHPNGLGYLSADDINTYRFYNMKHNMFTIGKGNGGVNVTNRNIMQNTSRGYIPLGIIK